jgi:hypothetical protein
LVTVTPAKSQPRAPEGVDVLQLVLPTLTSV